VGKVELHHADPLPRLAVDRTGVAIDERHGVTGAGEQERGGHPGRPGSDDDDLHGNLRMAYCGDCRSIRYPESNLNYVSTVKRSYSSDLRTEQARRTRWQIVTAARGLFEELGFAGTTIDAVAERAGVSRKTVFTSVGNKVELLHKAYDFAVGGDDEPMHMTERPELQRIIAQENPWEQMRMFADFITTTHSRIARLWLTLRSAAEVDAEARELFDRWEFERRQAMLTGPVPKLIAQKVLKPGLTAETAADLFWTFNDPALYHRLVLRAGWSDEQYRDWLRDLIPSQLLVPEPA